MISENSKFIVCYSTPAGEQRFTHAAAKYTDDGKVDIDALKADFPNAYITNVFNTNADLLYYETTERSEFERHCRNYDFEPTDYRRTVILPNKSQKWLLVGFETKRHKYKTRLLDPQNHTYLLCTLNAVRRGIV